VTSLLHLPITGVFHTFEAIDVEQVVDLSIELLELSRQYVKDEIDQCRRTYVRLVWLQDIYRSKCDARQCTVVAQAYLLHLVGSTIFANKSVTHINGILGCIS